MALIEWDESYSVNVHIIDRQHQKLFHHCNEYHEAAKNGKPESALRKLLDELVEYVAVHFSTEERLLVQNNYEDIVAHKQEHKILAAKIKDLNSKVKVGYSVEEDEVGKFLKVWLDAHIKGTDRQYMECLSNKN